MYSIQHCIKKLTIMLSACTLLFRTLQQHVPHQPHRALRCPSAAAVRPPQ
jgi:hypothetical protein